MNNRQSAPWPHRLKRRLVEANAQLCLRALMRGGGVTLVIACAGAIAAMTADFVWPLSKSVRMGLWLLWTGTILAYFLLKVARPCLRKPQWLTLAALVENQHPEACERLSTAVEFLKPKGRAHGSPELVDALIAQAEQWAEQRPYTPAVPRGKAPLWLAGGLFFLALMLLCVIVRPDPFAFFAQRFLLPWSQSADLSRFVIHVEPGNINALQGDEIAFRATVRPRFAFAPTLPPSAELVWTDDDGTQHRLPLITDAQSDQLSRSFNQVVSGLPGSMNYRVVCGPAQSEVHRINALPPPAVEQLMARVDPPAYTKLPPSENTNPTTLAVVEKSRVTVWLTPNRAMKRVEIQAGEHTSDQSSTVPPPWKPLVQRPQAGHTSATWAIELEIEQSCDYKILFEDDYNFTRQYDRLFTVMAVADQPPRLIVEGGDEPQEARADDLLVVGVAAGDDFSVADAELNYVIERNAKDATHSNTRETGSGLINLVGLGTPTATGQASLNIKTLGLLPGDELTYQVVVRDNRPSPPGPNVTRSKARRLSIRDNAESLATRFGRSRSEDLRAALEKIRKRAAENQQATVALRYAADAAQRGNGEWTRESAAKLDDLSQNAQREVHEIESLAQAFDQSEAFAPLAQPAQKIADVEAVGTLQMLKRAGEATNTSQRLADLRLADMRSAAMLTRLDELRQKFDELVKQDADREQLRTLAEREETLAQQAANTDDPNRDLNAIRQEQESLRAQVDDILRRSQPLRAELAARQALAAETLAKQAREVAERQRQQERADATIAREAEELTLLAKEQQSIADAARALAMEVDTPLQENGRGRVRTELLANPIEPLKRGDIERALQKVDEAAGELQRLNRELAEAREDPKVLARRLGRRQDELARQTSQLLAEADTPEKRANLPTRLLPIAAKQEQLRKLAEPLKETLPDPSLPNAAIESLDRASETVKSSKIDEISIRQAEARDALSRLVDALPEAWQTRQLAQQRVDQAKGQFDSVQRELEQRLRDTAQQVINSKDPANAAREFAQGLDPLIARQQEAAESLRNMKSAPEFAAQRNLAAQRAANLEREMHKTRELAPPESDSQRAQVPLGDWRVVGPFDLNAAAPFPLDQAPPMQSSFTDRLAREVSWQSVKAGEQGLVDLHALFGFGPETSNASAFAVAQFECDREGVAKLALGSDDTLSVWANGKLVFDFQGRRGFSPSQDQLQVALIAGTNRFVVRCGNGDADWKFAVSIAAPPSLEAAERLSRFETQKSHLSELAADTRAAIDRLRQAVDGRDTADARSLELARSLEKIAQHANDPAADDSLPSQLELAEAAIRTLETPDAKAQQARTVEALAKARQSLKTSKAREALALAAESANQLAARLNASDPKATPPNSVNPQTNSFEKDPDLGLTQQHDQGALALKQREQQLRDQLRAQIANRTVPQRAVQEEAATLAKDLSSLRDEVREVGQSGQAQAAAQAASDTLEHQALPAMNQANSELDNGRMHSARDAQRRAADSVEQAARHAADLASALKADSSIPSPGGQEPSQTAQDAPGQPSTSENLHSARSAQKRASQSLSRAGQAGQSGGEQAMREASTAMREAAQGLRAAASSGQAARKQLAQNQQSNTNAPSSNPNPQGNNGQAVGLSLETLDPTQATATSRRWGTLPPHLQEALRQTDQGSYRPEYARVIQLYFREIADQEPSEDMSKPSSR